MDLVVLHYSFNVSLDIHYNINDFVKPLFCPLSTCPFTCLFGTLQQFLGGPLLLVQLTFSEPL